MLTLMTLTLFGGLVLFPGGDDPLPVLGSLCRLPLFVSHLLLLSDFVHMLAEALVVGGHILEVDAWHGNADDLWQHVGLQPQHERGRAKGVVGPLVVEQQAIQLEYTHACNTVK